MNPDQELRLECLRLAHSMRSDQMVGGQLGMMTQSTPAPTAQQICDRSKMFYDFATNRIAEPAPTPVKVGDKLVVVGG